MNRVSQKRLWLAGASLLAIILASGDADAVLFGIPGSIEYTISSSGDYDFRIAGADGGGYFVQAGGGAGALVGGELYLDAGDRLDIVVGGAGQDGTSLGFNGYGSSGGGGSFVFNGGLLFAAGGGGGGSFAQGPGGPGIGSGGYPSGSANYGGGGGGGIPGFSQHGYAAQGGTFPFGGAGAAGSCCYGGPAGGFGGGGGAGYNGGGGGGGAPGGAGGYTFSEGGAGGLSYVTDMARGSFGITGGNPGSYGSSGYVSINFVGPPVPEPSTWGMTLTGFAGLGWLARLRRRKLTPA
jgi:hypothetical protein